MLSFVATRSCPLPVVVRCQLSRAFVRLFVRLFVCSFIRSFVCSFVCSFICSFVRSFACLLIRSFARSFVRSFACLFSRLLVCLLIRSFACSFVCKGGMGGIVILMVCDDNGRDGDGGRQYGQRCLRPWCFKDRRRRIKPKKFHMLYTFSVLGNIRQRIFCTISISNLEIYVDGYFKTIFFLRYTLSV